MTRFTILQVPAFLLAAALAVPAFAEEPEVKLIYPADAAAAELDSSRPEKRIEPPVRELSEQDVVTPLGQVRAVLASLKAIEESQEEVARDVAALKKLDVSNLFPVVEKSVEGQKEIELSVKSVAAKIDALQKTTENLRATVESVQKTAASVERIRTSRWTDYCVIAILALLLCQIVWKFGAAVAANVKKFVYAQAVEIANKQQTEAK